MTIAAKQESEQGTSHERREQLVRRMCEVMGWNYSQKPVWTALRKVALAKAVAVGLDKLEEVVDRLVGINPHQQLTEQELTERFYQVKEERDQLRRANAELIAACEVAAYALRNDSTVLLILEAAIAQALGEQS